MQSPGVRQEVRPLPALAGRAVRDRMPAVLKRQFDIGQGTPIALTKAYTDPDPAVAKRAFEAMMMKKIDIAAIEAARRG
jgi:2-polyprenyl-6-hydroxyphenyl methylase/3-demethylubiquinone-9 3-methyltransferase